jgi:hypothetical protein
VSGHDGLSPRSGRDALSPGPGHDALSPGAGHDAVGPGPGAKIIPLTPGPALSSGQRRAELREAVLQVVRHLVIETVPEAERSPYFDQATGLLDQAGYGLDELLDAASPGPKQDDLLHALGLDRDQS